MIHSFAFSTQGRLHSQDIDIFLMPTLLANTNLFLWVDLENPTPEEVKQVLEEVFHFHPLSIEDCVQLNSSPKVEEYTPKEDDHFDPYLFMVIHAVNYNRKDGVFDTSELDFFLGRNFLVTFHDHAIKGVATLEQKAIKGGMRVAKAPDRIAHSLLDLVVDAYKPALEELSLEISEIEQAVLESADRKVLNRIIQTKKEVMHLRQIIGPQREVLARFARGDFKMVRNKMMPYFRDVYDGLFRIHESAQSYTDSLTAILHVYLSLTSNQTGEVVKLLTLITVITAPIMIVGTWYGMNFEGMPELDSEIGYGIAGLVTLLTTGLTFWYFKRRNWF